MTDFIDEIMSLPEDWWRHPYAAIDFANLYQRHSLGLLLAIESQGRYKHEMLSGVSFYHHEHILWLTAGHVIEYLERVLQEYGDQITMMAWCDQSGSSDANYFPVSHRNFRRFYIYEDGIDIGFGILQGIDARNILETPGGPLLTAPLMETYVRIVPEGFHLVGYPGESGRITTAPYNESKTQITTDNPFVCLPIQQLERPSEGQASDDFWRNPEAFYGQIMEFSAEGPEQPSNIKGMSGGPIFAVSRSPDQGLQYYFAAIQSAWLPDSRLIRAVPIERAIGFIDRALVTVGRNRSVGI